MFWMKRMHTLLFSVLLVVGCGGDTADQPSTVDELATALETVGDAIETVEDTMEAATGEPIQNRITVRGTASRPEIDEWTAYRADCGKSTLEKPHLTALSIQAPAYWESRGTGAGDSGRGSIHFVIGSVEKSLNYHLEPEKIGKAIPAAILSTEDEQVEILAWGEREVPLYFDGSVYKAYYPAATVESAALMWAEQTGEYYARLRLGATGRGSTADIPREEVVGLFESVEIEECLTDYLARNIRQAEITIED